MNSTEQGEKKHTLNLEDVDIVGASAIAFLYMTMLLIGIWASWRQVKKKSLRTTGSEELYLAGRRLGLPVAVATLAATQIGGAFLSGTAEETFKNGILWCPVPFAYISGMVINGLLFARKMRRHGYLTVFDPLQENFGHVMGGLCVVPHIIGDLFWIGAVLSVLGSTLKVTLGLDRGTSILVSSAVGMIYTLCGGMLSVAYTDVLQIVVIFIGMFLSLSYVLTSEAVSQADQLGSLTEWLGHVSLDQAGSYADGILTPLLGGLPWQGYYQRALSLKTEKHVLPMSLLASILPLMMIVPPIVIGGVARTAAWNMTALGAPITPDDASLVLPLALRYLVPQVVTFFGVGAVTAAVMSTIDSAVLGASSAIVNNIYKGLLRTKASDGEVMWCSRISILAVGVAATGVAFMAESIYGLWYLSSDLMYVLVFPHFMMAMIAPGIGTPIASGITFFVGITLRVLVGEVSIGLPPVIRFPETIPVRTLTMTVSLFVLVSVSLLDQAYRSCQKTTATRYNVGENAASTDTIATKCSSFDHNDCSSSKDITAF
ncbi:high-affinity choline transporter 1-like [Hetaerina americana]|uniref:high-affinity choline transporter 1-like n=1 Tax=Hetaerina americana TaxID=62018 RepID=UPI003A7F4001